MGFFLEKAAYQGVRFALAPVQQSPRASCIRKYWEVLSAPLTDASSTSARSRWVLAKHQLRRQSALETPAYPRTASTRIQEESRDDIHVAPVIRDIAPAAA